MSSPMSQGSLLPNGARPAVRPLTPAEFRWSIRSPHGGTMTCELRDHGQWGIEVQMWRDGQFLFGRRCADRSAALAEAGDLRADRLRDGGVLVRER